MFHCEDAESLYGSNAPSFDVFSSPVWFVLSNAKGWSLPVAVLPPLDPSHEGQKPGNMLLASRSKIRNVLALESFRALSPEAGR